MRPSPSLVEFLKKLFTIDAVSLLGFLDGLEEELLLFRCELKTPVVLRSENGDGGPFLKRITLDDDLAFDHFARYKSHMAILPRAGPLRRAR